MSYRQHVAYYGCRGFRPLGVSNASADAVTIRCQCGKAFVGVTAKEMAEVLQINNGKGA